ncbi:MAG: hypothetical protein K2G36_00750 [Ruminococcus sp.]|nr:hypothetical protein [Ruminococcus sp.]
MIMCSKCKKIPAIVFIKSEQANEKWKEKFCFSCAKEQNNPQVWKQLEEMVKWGIIDKSMLNDKN